MTYDELIKFIAHLGINPNAEPVYIDGKQIKVLVTYVSEFDKELNQYVLNKHPYSINLVPEDHYD